MRYFTKIYVEAEQFLPEKDQIPAGVRSDGPRTPKVDPRAAWVVNTKEGVSYLNDGDYILTSPDGDNYVMSAEIFEANYTPEG